MDMVRKTLLTAAALAEQPDFALGALLVSPSTRVLTRGADSEKVEPRVMQVLLVLADAEGRVVTRDELLERCWGGVFVGDDSLNRIIAGIRRIASGIGAGSFTIETIPRTGYRLLASSAPALEEPSPAPPQERGFDRRWVLGGGMAAAGAALALWRWGPGTGSDPVAALLEQSRATMRAGTPEATGRAVALLEQAVDAAPDRADAWGLLALTRARADEHAIDATMFDVSRVDVEANRALQLDPGNVDARAALAIALPYYGDWAAAERRFDAVLADAPEHVFVRDSRSFLLASAGLMRAGSEDRVSLADAQLDDASLRNRYIYALWFLDRVADANRVASDGLAMWPGHPGIWFAKLWLLAGTGRLDRAIAFVNDVAGRPPLPPPMFDGIGMALGAAASGRPEAIAAASDGLLTGVAQSVTAVVNAMMLFNVMGATDRAFDLAEAYYLEQGPIIAAMHWRPGQPNVPDQRRRKTNVLFTPVAASMQRDPRFMALMERIGLAQYWADRGVAPDFLA